MASCSQLSEIEDGLFEDDLQGVGDIEMALFQRSAAGAGGTEPLLETGRLDRVGAVLAPVDDAAEGVDVGGLPVGGQGHHLVFVGRVQEAEIFRHLLVEDAERVGHLHLADAPQVIAAPLVIAGRDPFPSSIEGEDSRALERRGEKRAGRVGDVVLDEMPLIGTIRARTLEAGREVVRGAAGQMARRVDHRGDEEGIPGRLPLGGHRVGARLERQGERGLIERTSHPDGRIERVGDMVNVGERDRCLAQAVVDGVKGQFPGRKWNRPLAVLDPGEPLFFCRGDDLAVLDQARRRVVERGIDPQRVHQTTPISLPVRRGTRPLRMPQEQDQCHLRH